MKIELCPRSEKNLEGEGAEVKTQNLAGRRWGSWNRSRGVTLSTRVQSRKPKASQRTCPALKGVKGRVRRRGAGQKGSKLNYRRRFRRVES